MGQENYVAVVGCRNCKNDSTITIQKGTTVEEYLKQNNICGNCGCETLFKY